MSTRFLPALTLSISLIGCSAADPPPASSPQAAQGTAARSKAAGEVRVVPGTSIGPLRLGMGRAEIEELGVLRPHPLLGERSVPYVVAYDEGGLARLIGISVRRSRVEIRVDQATIPRGASLEQVSRLLGDCTQPDAGPGGGGYVCRGGSVLVSIGSGAPDEVWITIKRER